MLTANKTKCEKKYMFNANGLSNCVLRKCENNNNNNKKGMEQRDRRKRRKL